MPFQLGSWLLRLFPDNQIPKLQPSILCSVALEYLSCSNIFSGFLSPPDLSSSSSMGSFTASGPVSVLNESPTLQPDIPSSHRCMFKSQSFHISTPCFQKHHYSSYTVIVFPSSEPVASDPAASASLVPTGATQLCVLVQSPCPRQQASSSAWWYPHDKSLIMKNEALWWIYLFFCCSVTQSCPTLSNPMDCSMPGFPVCHQLPELAQTHVHQVSDAIQPSHLLSSPSPFPATGSFPVSWLVASGGQTIGASASASVLPMNIQGWFSSRLTGLIFLQSKRLIWIIHH